MPIRKFLPVVAVALTSSVQAQSIVTVQGTAVDVKTSRSIQSPSLRISLNGSPANVDGVGRFFVSLPANGLTDPFMVRAEAECYEPAEGHQPGGATGQPITISMKPLPTTKVEGVVRDAGSLQPIAKAQITAKGLHGDVSDTSDSQGRFSLLGVRCDHAALRILASGYVDFHIRGRSLRGERFAKPLLSPRPMLGEKTPPLGSGVGPAPVSVPAARPRLEKTTACTPIQTQLAVGHTWRAYRSHETFSVPAGLNSPTRLQFVERSGTVTLKVVPKLGCDKARAIGVLKTPPNARTAPWPHAAKETDVGEYRRLATFKMGDHRDARCRFKGACYQPFVDFTGAQWGVHGIFLVAKSGEDWHWAVKAGEDGPRRITAGIEVYSSGPDYLRRYGILDPLPDRHATHGNRKCARATDAGIGGGTLSRVPQDTRQRWHGHSEIRVCEHLPLHQGWVGIAAPRCPRAKARS